MVKTLFLLTLVMLFALPLPARAAAADLSIDQGSITFSTTTFYSGNEIRIYARIRNIGEVDMTATVIFYQGSMVIGSTQPVSLRAGGAPEEVFVDFTVPNGSFNIRAIVSGANPVDENSLNNEATTVLFTPVQDDDRDGVEDDVDNCPNEENANQADGDGDGQGDACDTDDDNDGLSDTAEVIAQTDPADTDTDDDGMIDGEDSAPATAYVAPVSEPKQAATSPNPSVTGGEPEATPPATGETEGVTVSVAEATAERPSSAFGIFGAANAEDADNADAEWQPFFRLSNPWISVSLVVLALLIIAAIGGLVYSRRRGEEDEL